jgi:ribosomal protein L40E
MGAESVEEGVVCWKCGFKNPPGAKFCANCGTRLKVKAPTVSESLALLHFVGSLYLLISLAANYLVRALLPLSIAYLASGVLSLLAGYLLYRERPGRLPKLVSAVASASGLVSTLALFALGLTMIRGVIGPAWLIFAASLWELWRLKGARGGAGAAGR